MRLPDAVLNKRAPLIYCSTMLAVFAAAGSHADVCAQRWSDREISPVIGIVTGLPHSGTTVMAWQIKNMPGVWSGFECGFLEGETPADFKQAASFHSPGEKLTVWNVTAEGLERIRSSECHVDMYDILIQEDWMLSQMPGVRVLDKMPAYVNNLASTLRRAPNVPCIVMTKGGMRTPSHEQALRDPQLAPRILEVQYEKFVVAPNVEMKRVLSHLKLDVDLWNAAYLMKGTGVQDKMDTIISPGYGNALVGNNVRFQANGGNCNKRIFARTNGTQCHAAEIESCRELKRQGVDINTSTLCRHLPKIRRAR